MILLIYALLGVPDKSLILDQLLNYILQVDTFISVVDVTFVKMIVLWFIHLRDSLTG